MQTAVIDSRITAVCIQNALATECGGERQSYDGTRRGRRKSHQSRKGFTTPTVDQDQHAITSCPVMVTSTVDGRDHLIDDRAMADGCAASHGQFTVLCGHLVVAAALVAPPGPLCRDCAALLRSEASRHRVGVVARMLRLCRRSGPV
jgi:hypothetical protein